MFPDRSETLLLEKLAAKDYENTRRAGDGLDALAEFGGSRSVEELSRLAGDESDPDFRTAIERAVRRIERRLEIDQSPFN